MSAGAEKKIDPLTNTEYRVLPIEDIILWWKAECINLKVRGHIVPALEYFNPMIAEIERLRARSADTPISPNAREAALENELMRQYEAHPEWDEAKDVIEGLDCAALLAAISTSPLPRRRGNG